MPLEKLANKIGWTLSQAKENAEILKNEGKIFEILEGIFIHSAYIEKSMSKLEKLLEDYHRKNPISPGMNKEEFRDRLDDAKSPEEIMEMFRQEEQASFES